MTKRVVSYPRGFQGFDIGFPIQTKGDTVKDTIKNISLNREHQELRFVISNQNVENLWKAISNGVIDTTNFDVREKIVCNALVAFGCESFLEWMQLQETNPNLTDLHRRFINDTLKFIETGKRSLSLFSWGGLIHIRPLTAKDSSPALNAESFFNLNAPIQHRKNQTVCKVVSRWVSHENGFEDLAGTLHVLFGDTV